MYLTLCCS